MEERKIKCMKALTVYKCDFCDRLFKTVKGANNHETKLCFHNPDTQSCFTCGLFIDEEVKTDFTLTGFAFHALPHCEYHHDMYYEDLDGETYCNDSPRRERGCGMWEPREDHPGEYAKWAVGSGGYRKVYLPKEGEK